MKYKIEIWGCQMNEHESEIIAGILESKGIKKTANIEEADIVVLYTCCIRKKVENKVLGRLGILSKLKKNKNKKIIIALGGCMTQQEDVAKTICKRFKEIDIIFGTHNLNKFDIFLDKKFSGIEKIYEISKNNMVIINENIKQKRKNKFKAYVSIIFGCNNFCSYCIVPYVRGREKSREIKFILKEVENLLKKGYKEITLLGQNVNSYGNDFKNSINFELLLKKLDSLGNYRLRFMTSHPKDFNFKLIDMIKKSKNICHQFHLPLQSGSNKILKKMNRGYTIKEYLNLINYIKKIIPDATISTDIIIGFPGETNNDFKETLFVIEKISFDQVYMFLYSARNKTIASKMKNQINEKVKKDRFSKLLNLQKEKSIEKNKKMIGKKYEILIEEKKENNIFSGRTRGNKIVNFVSKKNNLIGKLTFVKIKKATAWSLSGDLLE